MKMKKTALPFLFTALLLAGTLSGCGTSATGISKSPLKAAVTPEKPGVTLRDQLADKTWLLAGYLPTGTDAGSVFVPLEPGHGSTAWILLGNDGKLNGSTGINTFSGSWKLGSSTKTGTGIAISVGGMTRIGAPNEIAAKFEKDLIRELGEARRLKTGKDSIQLVNGQDKTLLQFIYRDDASLF